LRSATGLRSRQASSSRRRAAAVHARPPSFRLRRSSVPDRRPSDARVPSNAGP
jgi:hypothetical protein